MKAYNVRSNRNMYIAHTILVLVVLIAAAAAGFGSDGSGSSDGSGGSGISLTSGSGGVDVTGGLDVTDDTESEATGGSDVTKDTESENSVRTDDTQDEESDSTPTVVVIPWCFPADALVYVDNAAQPLKTMRQLQIGDQVLSMRNDGQAVFSPVMAFLHRESDENAATYFVKLETVDGYTLRLTPDHLVFRNGSRGATGVFAFMIEPGDFVYTTDASLSDSNPQGDTLTLSQVTSVSTAKEYGMYGPVTTEGTVIVDGVAASCYAGVADQELAHWSFAPLRLMHRLMPSIVETDGDGMHWYPRMMLQFVKYARPLVAPLLTGKVHPAYPMISGDSSPMQVPINGNCNVK